MGPIVLILLGGLTGSGLFLILEPIFKLSKRKSPDEKRLEELEKSGRV